MLLNELFRSIKEAEAPKQLGRAFNHLEDLVFFHGTAGTREALQHIRDFATAEGASSIRMKWDGCIHKDSIILTTQGDMTIESITNLIKQNQSVIIIGKDMLSMDNIEAKVIGESVSEGIKDWVEIELENGSILKMTVDHKVYTKNRGWVEAGKLTTDDDIQELNDKGAIALEDYKIYRVAIARITKLVEKHIQYDITTETENFYVKAGNTYLLIHNSPQIYWGRETKGGPLLLAGHNGWSRGAKTDSPDAVKDFIANKSGAPKTPEEQTARNQFAEEFANLYPLFDRATPKDFVGFVYADGLFLQRPAADSEGVYNFAPNPKSQTAYHVRATSELGKRISRAKVMVVGHAYFPEFGMPDSAQKPISDFSQFDKNPELIVLGPVYNTKSVAIDLTSVADVENDLKRHGAEIDNFLKDTPGLTGLKNTILYPYVNQTAKAKQLDNLSHKHFMAWLGKSKVSAGQQAKIADKIKQDPNALDALFVLVKKIQNMKDNIIDQVEGEQGDVWDTHGEGRVRYADPSKQFGNVKLVPRKRWTPT